MWIDVWTDTFLGRASPTHQQMAGTPVFLSLGSKHNSAFHLFRISVSHFAPFLETVRKDKLFVNTNYCHFKIITYISVFHIFHMTAVLTWVLRNKTWARDFVQVMYGRGTWSQKEPAWEQREQDGQGKSQAWIQAPVDSRLASSGLKVLKHKVYHVAAPLEVRSSSFLLTNWSVIIISRREGKTSRHFQGASQRAVLLQRPSLQTISSQQSKQLEDRCTNAQRGLSGNAQHHHNPLYVGNYFAL